MNDTTLTLIDLSVKGTAVLLIGFGSVATLRHGSAAQRSLAWLAVFTIMLALPFALLVKPVWTVPVHVVIEQIAMVPKPMTAEPIIVSEESQSVIAPIREPVPWTLWQWLAGIYSVGACGVLAFRWIGSWQLSRLRRSSRGANAEIVALVQRLSLDRRIQTLVSDDIAVPMTWGTLRPTLLLPSSVQQWSATDLRAALEHELAHIRHRDAARRWLGTLVSALWWPHPLVWIASKAWKLEQERACDDAVVRSGANTERYATQLIEAAHSIRLGGFRSAAALVMAMPTGLETRLHSVVSTDVNRSGTGNAFLLLTSVTSMFVLALSTVCRAQAVALNGATAPVVLLDAGHGGHDSGATGHDLVEKDVTLQLVTEMANELRAAGVKVELSRATDVYVSLEDRVKRIREINPSLVASIHVNEVERKGSGMAVFTQDLVLGQRFATALREEVKIKTAAFTVLKGSPGPALMVQAANLSNEEDAKRLSDPSLRKALVGRLSAAIISILPNLEPSPPQAIGDEPVFTIFGQVFRQGKYPLKKDTTLKDAMQSAGGVTAFADTTHIRLNRKQADKKEVLVLDLANDGSTTLLPNDTVIILDKQQGVSPLQTKSQSLRLPKTTFSNATLPEAVDYLRAKSREFDPDKQGINIIVKEDAGKTAKLTLDLRDVPLHEALRYVTELSNTHVTYTTDAVVIAAGPSEDMSTRVYRLPINELSTTAKEWLVQKKVNFPEGAAAVFDPKTRQLTVKNTNAELRKVEDLMGKLRAVMPNPKTQTK